jgi:nucleotide-binding universal stress UspA family protein
MTQARTLTRLLVPLDGSPLAEQALPYARALATAETQIILLEVVPWADEIRTVLGKLIATAAEVQEAYEASAREELEAARKQWLGDRQNVTIEVAAGDPAEQILWAAERHAVDLIVMASHGRGALGRWTFGSVADRIARASTIPVMIIHPKDTAAQPTTQAQIQRIVLLTDGSSLSLQAIPMAAMLAKTLNLPVHVLRALDPATVVSRAPVPLAPLPHSLYEDILSQIKTDAENGVKAVVEHVAALGITASGDVLEGPPSPTLLGALLPTDIVVLTSHGRTGLRRWLLGSIAEKVIRNGVAPVVLVPSAIRAESPEPAAQARPVAPAAPA